ncbi:protein NETWORKED 2A-like [Hibiscus syriacus]|uniref:protein NETWORKED 2A-like n=1 Tax=Hibiscus syriacus TaxID=106335 RepID=UPI00192220EF|nr:protein NETWORKED 2A-like [Hibiscus syriacus]
MMLHRVSSNVYPWWWASHIRTKQSKWLEQNLHDMEEKFAGMLEIIDDDGDSFIRRANMYFKKRPELLSIVEDTYRAYRALAERYDLLSRDLQSANRTIATMFPDQVPYSIHDEDDENGCLASPRPDTPPPSKPGSRVPVPNIDFRSQSMLLLRKGQLKKSISSAEAGLCPQSGLSKEEALEEINKLEKEILEMQTEWELVKNSYEQAYKRLCAIENGISEKQKRVCSLQDEYDIRSTIDDNEARVLMANRVLKTCHESLVKLQQTHEQSTEEGRVESKRIKKANEAFEALRRKFNCPPTKQELKRVSSATDVNKMVYEFEIAEKDSGYIESLQKEIEEKLESSLGSSLTMSQLADKIDDLIQRVVNLENAVFSENASVKRLKSDADDLQEHVKNLEEDEEALVGGSECAEQRICALERELSRVKDLLRTVIDQNNSLKAHFAEAKCNINHLSVNLHAVNMDEEFDNLELSKEGKPKVDAKSDRKIELKEETEGKDEDDSAEGRNDVDSESSNKIDADSDEYKGAELMDESKVEKKCISRTASSTIDTDNPESETDEEEELQKWRKLYNSGSDERDKILLDEYSTVLRNYKGVKKKLKEVDRKNRDSFYELAYEIRELKTALATRDEEIKLLRRKSSLTESEASHAMISPESTLSDFIQISPVAADEGKVESIEREAKATRRKRSLSRSRSFLTSEGKIRADIDELLEDNIAFWMRFSTSFHQIQKYETSVQDLKSELSTLRERKKQEANGKEEPLGSEGRPIYAHLREIKAEVTLWLETNAVLKDEVQGRYSSLCNIEEEVLRMSKSNDYKGELELDGYQAARFQGELLNMKQENSKVSNELKEGFDRMQQLKEDIGNVMANLEKGIEAASASRLRRSGSSTRNRIPLRSFLFGIKLRSKRQKKGSSISGQPQFQPQRSYGTEPTEPP